MEKDYYTRVLGYKSAMAQARVKLSNEIITGKEYAIWTVMVERAVIHWDRRVTFVFYNGNEITTVA